MYQIYAYGKRYGCEAVALAYPRTGRFAHILRYRLFDGLPLICLPFDVTKPGESVRLSLQALAKSTDKRSCGRPEFYGEVPCERLRR